MKEPNKEQLLDDLYFFCLKLKLKRRFYGGGTTTDKEHQKERCDLNIKLPDCYFNENYETPSNLQRFITIVKKEVTELLKKYNYQQKKKSSNLSICQKITI